MRYLKLTQDNFYCISSAQGREIYIWKLRHHWKKDKQQNSKTNSNNTSMNKNEKSAQKQLKLESAVQKLVINDQVVDVDIFQISVKIEKSDKNANGNANEEDLKEDSGNKTKTKTKTKSKKKGKKKNSNAKNENKNNTISKHKYFIAAASKSEIHVWLYEPSTKKTASTTANKRSHVMIEDNKIDSNEKSKEEENEEEEDDDIDIEMNSSKTKKGMKNNKNSSKSKSKTKSKTKRKGKANNANSARQHQKRDETKFNSLRPVCTIKLANYGSLKDSNSKSKDKKITYSWIRGIQFVNNKEILIARGNPSMVIFKKIEFALTDNDFVNDIKLDIVDASTFSGNGSSNVVSSNLTRIYEKEKATMVDSQLNVMDVADSVRPQPKSIDMWHSAVDNDNENDHDNEGDDNDKDVSVITGQKRNKIDKIDENEEDTMLPPKKKQKTLNKTKNNDSKSGKQEIEIDNDENDNDNANDNGNADGNDSDKEMEAKNEKDLSMTEKKENELNRKSTGMTFAEKLATIESKDEENRKLGLLSAIPTADSLAQLLKQSLVARVCILLFFWFFFCLCKDNLRVMYIGFLLVFRMKKCLKICC